MAPGLSSVMLFASSPQEADSFPALPFHHLQFSRWGLLYIFPGKRLPAAASQVKAPFELC